MRPWLVGQDERGLRDQGARNGHALLLPARQLRGGVRRALGQAHARQRRAGAGLALGRLDTGIDQGQFHILQRAGACQQVELLEHKANPPVADGSQRIRRQRMHGLARQVVTAAVGQVQATQDVHERGLARARRPHDGHELARVDLQRHAAQRVHGLPAHGVGLGERLRVDQGWSHAQALLRKKGAAPRYAPGHCWPGWPRR